MDQLKSALDEMKHRIGFDTMDDLEDFENSVSTKKISILFGCRHLPVDIKTKIKTLYHFSQYFGCVLIPI